MANLYDIFHGAVGLCQQYGSAYSLQQIPNEPLTVCGTYIEAARFVRVEQHDGNEKVVEFKGVVEVEIGKNDFDNNLDLEKNNDKEINNDDCKTNESIC
ncbi:8283_t:CDS:2 [Gigaspora margarita]|uniref:8283_t:CDS:1 n=1 Tax=Gigaspora margarita TaxID=4874 RepID=A0ABN7UTN0_GIGMA|nr:8283_t:CDS:2 [Gigaspora margarita]